MQMLQERSQLLQAKQRALQATQEKKMREKERLTQEILQYGLWQTQHDVRKALSQLKFKSAKVKAIKAQLDFRTCVLEQKHPDKDVIFISKQLTVDELIINLEKLLAESAPLDLDRHTVVNQESLVGKRMRHKWNNVEGDKQWYTGLILSVVDGSTEWFNVQYDGEEDVLTLNLYEDIDLDIIT